MFPVADTPWHDGNPPKIVITPKKAVSEMLKGIRSNQNKIRVSKVKLLYFIYRLAPKFAFKKRNSVSQFLWIQDLKVNLLICCNSSRYFW